MRSWKLAYICGQPSDAAIDIVSILTVDAQWKDKFYMQVEDYLHGRKRED